MRSAFLFKLDEIIGSVNHSDMDEKDWVDRNKIGGLSQSIPEWRAFLEYVSIYFKYRSIEKPIILEIGTEDNYQKRFYQELFNAEYIGVDIDPSVKGMVDIIGNSHSEKTLKRIKARLAGRPIDLLFIDGDHSYSGAKQDYKTYGALTRHLIALHDIFNTKINADFPPVETHRLWKEICEKEKNYTLISFHKNRRHEREPWVELGIGLIVKDGNGDGGKKPDYSRIRTRKDTEDTNLEKSDEDIFFDGANGIGDTIYQRIVIKHLIKRFKTIYLHTPCPDIFWDIPDIKYVKEGNKWLRTQAKYEDSLPEGLFVKLPKRLKRVTYDYCPVQSVKHCAAWIIRKQLDIKIEDFDFEFPIKPSWIEAAESIIENLDMGGKKLCIVRPSTLRAEWSYPTRNPKLEYYQLLIDKYKNEYFYMSIADLEDGKEWLDGRLEGIDIEFHKGELPLPTIFGLMKLSDMILCYPAFFMVAGIAIRAKTFAIFGGCSSPEASIEDSMGLDSFSYVAPNPACNCFLQRHNCNKEIPIKLLLEKFEELRSR